MHEKNNVVDQQQEKVLALKLPNASELQASPEKYKAIYRAGVDNAQRDLGQLGKGFDDPDIEGFVDNSLDTISGKLQGIAQTALHYKRSVDKPLDPEDPNASFDREEDKREAIAVLSAFTQELEQDIAKAHREAERWEAITKIKAKIDQTVSKKNEIIKNTQDKSVEVQLVAYTNLIQDFDSLERDIDPSISTIVNKNYFDTQSLRIMEERKELIRITKILLIHQDPEKYIAFAQERLQEDLVKRIYDPNLITSTLEQFQIQAAQFIQEAKDVNDDSKLIEMMETFEENFEKQTPFDAIELQGDGKLYVCKFIPPEKYENYEKCKQHAEKTIELYENYNANNAWTYEFGMHNKGIEFINGVITLYDTDIRSNNAEMEHQVRIDGYEVFYQSKLEALDRRAFIQAFDAWKQNGDDTTGFQYGEPLKMFDAAPYLQNTKKTDLTLDIIFQDPSEEIKDFLEPQYNKIKSQHKVYEKKKSKLIKKEETILLTTDQDNRKLIKIEYGKHGLRIRETIEIFTMNNLTHQIDVTKEVIENTISADGLDTPKITVTKFENDREKERMVEDFRDGRLVKRTTSVAGIDNVTAVDYADGNPLKRTEGERPGNFTRIIKITTPDGVEHIIKPYPEAKKDNPNLTEMGYFDFLAKMFPDDQTTYALQQLVFKYVDDSTNPDNPLEKGTEENYGDFWQLSSETLNRTEDGQYLGDCDDKAGFFDAKNRAAGRISYVIFMPDHAENIVVERDSNGMWHASSYGEFGVDRDGNRVGGSFDPEKAKGYKTLKEALVSINEKWVKDGRMGKGIFYRGEDRVDIMDVHLPIEQRGSNWLHATFKDKHKGWIRDLSLEEIEDEVED